MPIYNYISSSSEFYLGIKKLKINVVEPSKIALRKVELYN